MVSAISRLCTAVGLSVVLIAPGKAVAGTTVENLQVAFNGESNAHERYLAFAKQADTEGYGQIASLFRAAARAEKIHASNHAAVLQELGAKPKASIEKPIVKSTRENLEAAIKGETYEFESMYPDFLKQARLDRNSRAVRTFNLAKAAEIEHAKLYKAALDNLDDLKGSTAVSYLVCPICGFTTSDANFEKCPSCFTPKDEFEKVS